MFQALVVVLATCLAPVHSTFGTIPNPSATLQVYALPVGQGDCTIIQCPMPGQLIINDCGSSRSSSGAKLDASGVSAYLGSRVNDVVAILISHANSDHYSYLPSITSSANTNIQSVIVGGRVNDYSTIQKWLNDFGTDKLHEINGGSSCIGTAACTVPGGTNFCNNMNINFNILAANVGSTPNQRSIVLKVVAGQFNILLPGDMEGPASEMIASDPAARADLQSFVYKMAHHGASSIANLPAWLAPITPQRAFASSAYNRGYCRHPRCETINRIRDLGTIAMAPEAHAFYCGNSNANPTVDPAFTLHMYQTSPTSDMICLLTYASDASFNENCMAPPAVAQAQVSNGESNDMCFSVSEGATAHYSIIVTMLALYASSALR